MGADEYTFDLHVNGFTGPVRTKLTRDEVGRLKVIARELHGQDNVHVVLSGRVPLNKLDETRADRDRWVARVKDLEAQLQRVREVVR